ncbi:DNA dC-_dU-editing enzyme APOBEC-3G-like isoform X1 [Mustela erminea]|uniref:DNA dC->dU-editing enzyme APOBEC-3G-like isoform X1 n=1 Tax=Mustela erminea TaxID=36723 RepID=UPI001386F149|nr:DNA dC->dU-editing enzyme APOBEC-3G-like isoform X1 [Mustela erminea]
MDAGAEAWDRLDEDTFIDNFHNAVWASRTYLCYEVEHPGQGSGIPPGQDKGVLRNKSAQYPMLSRHAESFLLEQIQSWNLDPEHQYRVTCFLSWSPCADCAQRMAEFLGDNSHVSLNLYASRIYSRGEYEQGLRTLKRAGAGIAIMNAGEFEHCWDTFVLHQGRSFQPWEGLDKESQKFSESLHRILQQEA